jgi:hypothetical protein
MSTLGRQKRAYSVTGLVVMTLVGIGLIIGPFIYILSLSGRQASANARASTQIPPTDPPVTITFSTVPQNTTTTEAESTTTTEPTTTTVPTTTTATTTTTTTTAAPTTQTTTTTHTTTTHTTTTRPTTTPQPSCQTCSNVAKVGACAVEYGACGANTYNCPVLCYGTFLMNGAVPATCLNGAIPQWPPFRDCLCNSGGCGSMCTANCAYTTVSTSVPTTPPATVCDNCLTVAAAGPCSAEYAACTANPTSGCALLCVPYYRSNLPIYTGCTNAMLVPEWNALATCLCANGCGTNTTCTANQCP